MLRIEGLNCFYGNVQVLRDFALELKQGEVLCLLGRNGAGKTTLLKAIMGLVRPRSGRVVLDGTDLAALPAHAVPKQGIGYCPQGRRLFSDLTVEENLQIGLMTRKRGPETLGRVLGLFPVLQQRMRQRAGTLSGGEQQMLATARALCLEPKVLLLDEPTEGLAPIIVEELLKALGTISRAGGICSIIVEQNAQKILGLADRVVILERGAIVHDGSSAALKADPAILERFLGVSGATAH